MAEPRLAHAASGAARALAYVAVVALMLLALGTVADIVMRYVFVSRDWEIGLEWHVMAEPDDWAHLYLRHRWTDLLPSFGAEVTSVLRGDPPHAVVPSPWKNCGAYWPRKFPSGPKWL